MEHALPRSFSDDAWKNSLRSRHRPRNCVWELTLGCNLSCLHCGSSAGRARRDELTTDQCLDLVDQLADLGCELITLSGGEPMLRPDLYDIARAIADRGIRVNMVTNGLLITDESAARIKASGMCNVGVSIDGPQEIHDRIRAPGSFVKSVEGIRTLVANGVSVGVMTTINRLNIDHLARIRQIAMEAGASMWRLQLAKPMGEICGDTDFVIRPRDLLQVIPQLAAMKRQGGIHLAVGDSIGYYGPHDQTLRGRGWRGRAECWQGCRAGMDAIGIEADGGVKGCLSIQAKAPDGSDPWREGSVKEHSLAEIWFRTGAFGYNRDFTDDQLKGACRTCGKASRCRGGARCVSTALTGTIGEDPYCWLRVSTTADNRGIRDYAARAAAVASLALLVGGAACDDDEDDKTDNGAEVVVLDAIGDDTATSVDAVRDDLAGDPGATPDLPVVTDAGQDAVNCVDVCCDCEYGVIPEEIFRQCCEVVQPDPAPDAVTPDVVQPDSVEPDAIDCDSVCCMCDYGIIPQEVWDKCCAEPPVEPVPDVVEPVDATGTDAGVKCSEICCNCEYGIIPEEVYQECCVEACVDVCCECDYGEPPPPQCCN